MHGQVEQNSHVDVTGKAFYPTTRVNQVRFIINYCIHAHASCQSHDICFKLTLLGSQQWLGSRVANFSIALEIGHCACHSGL